MSESRHVGFNGVRAAWGAVLLLAPDHVVRAVSGQPATTSARVVARILGVRHLAQAGAGLVWPGTTTRYLGLVTDTAHACTGLAFALLPTRWRRGALLDAGLAALFGAAGAVTDPVGPRGVDRTASR